MACAPSKWAGVLGAAVALGCMPPSFAPDRHAKDLKQGGAGLLSTGSRCEAVRPPTKPDLFGWDAGSRGELASIARQGVVVVQYQTRGCDAQLSVLNNCTVRAASYQFSPYTE